MRRVLHLHPILFASHAGLALLASNLGQITPSAVLRSLLVAIGLTLILLLGLRAALKDTPKAALIASGAVLLVSSYGHVVRLAPLMMSESLAAPLVSALWFASLILWVGFVWRRLADPLPLTRYFVAFSLLLNVFPALNLLSFSRDTVSTEAWIEEYRGQAAVGQGLHALDRVERQPGPAPQPDIYYIVLDAYARGDVLSEIYDYDNEAFLSALRERGFYVAEASNSNYPITELSIASTLEMIHLTGLPDGLEQQGVPPSEQALRDASSHLIARNRLVNFLRAAEYQILVFDGGYRPVYLDGPDQFLQSPGIDQENLWRVGFEVMLLDTTVGRVVTGWLRDLYSPLQSVFEAHRERVLYTLATLPEAAAQPGPKFVYAHIVSPHVPYVFGPNGERISAEDPYTLFNARPGAEDNIERYRDQVHYLNQLVLMAVDGILENSERPPVIILQSDHGGKVYSEPDPPRTVELQLRYPILNAYYLPHADAGWLRPDITPVNSFRGVLNSYFDLGLPPAPDVSYRLQETDDGVRFVETCPPPVTCR